MHIADTVDVTPLFSVALAATIVVVPIVVYTLLAARRNSRYHALYVAIRDLYALDSSGRVIYAVQYDRHWEFDALAQAWMGVPGRLSRKVALIRAGFSPQDSIDPKVRSLSVEDLQVMAALMGVRG